MKYILILMILALALSACAKGNMQVNFGGSPSVCCEQVEIEEEVTPELKD